MTLIEYMCTGMIREVAYGHSLFPNIQHPYWMYTMCFSTLICCGWAYGCTLTLLYLCRWGRMLKNWGEVENKIIINRHAKGFLSPLFLLTMWVQRTRPNQEYVRFHLIAVEEEISTIWARNQSSSKCSPRTRKGGGQWKAYVRVNRLFILGSKMSHPCRM